MWPGHHANNKFGILTVIGNFGNYLEQNKAEILRIDYASDILIIIVIAWLPIRQIYLTKLNREELINQYYGILTSPRHARVFNHNNNILLDVEIAPLCSVLVDNGTSHHFCTAYTQFYNILLLGAGFL